MPEYCLKCSECAWENLDEDLEPCDSCYHDSNFEPKAPFDKHKKRSN